MNAVPDAISPIEISELELDADDRGFVINGVSAYDYSGVSVSGAGDVNGDGLDVSAFGFADFAALQAVASASGPGGHDTLIQLDADDSILLEDFDLAGLNADDVTLT